MLENELAKILRDINPVIVKNFHSSHKVNIKSDDSIVTQTDREVERILVPRLKELLPDSMVIGEESAAGSTKDVDSFFRSEYLWAVDPIDGTVNFASGIPLFTVSVGLLKRTNNGYSVVAGAISFPKLSEVYYTKENKTYLKNFELDLESEIKRTDDDAVHTFLIPNHFRTRFNAGRENRLSNNIRQLGSTAADLLYVATGKASATITVAHLWDIAGGLAIAKTQGLYARELLSGTIKKSFTEDDFLYGDPKNHWRIKEPIVLCSDQYFSEVQELLKD